MEHLEDTALIARIAHADEAAFQALYQRTAGAVHAAAARIVRDPMLAEEVTQDTFLKLWSRAGLYLPERGSVRTWLLSIARRTALDRLRQEARRPVLLDAGDPEALLQEIPDIGTTCEESRWRTILLTVRSLAPIHRQLLELAFYQGLSQREIAEVLGWPLGTVKTRLPAAVRGLRREWDKQA